MVVFLFSQWCLLKIKVFNLDDTPFVDFLFILIFIVHVFLSYLRNLCKNPRLLLLLSSKDFIVLALLFRSMIHFKLFFV